MQRVCQHLERRGVDLSECDALDLFAREGDWQAWAYADRVKSICAWEIDPRHEAGLRANLPQAHIRIGDSFVLAGERRYYRKFNLIVMDNPHAVYGDNNQYCEHFNIMAHATKLLMDHGVIVFNVNHTPFDFDCQKEWQRRRSSFYDRKDTSSLALEFLIQFYQNYFQQRGLRTNYCFYDHRDERYLANFVFELKRHQSARL